jgi:hypothetical protein
VREYLGALMQGDATTAYGLLAADPGSPDAKLAEKDFLDRSARIVDINAHTTSPTTAIVETDIQSSKGGYFARFTVVRQSGGNVMIVQHDFIKP